MANGEGRALRAYSTFRRTQLAELGLQAEFYSRRNQQKAAEDKAAQEAAEKLADEKAGQSITELNKAVSAILSRPGTYDETQRIRPEVWDGQIEPLLGQMGTVKSKTWDGLDYVNSIRLRTAHRMPEPAKETPVSQLSDEEGFLQDFFAAEEANLGRPMSAAERIVARSKGTAEYTRLKAAGTAEGKETDLSREEQIQRRAERMLTNPLFQLKPEEALKRSTEFQEAFEAYQQNPDFFKVPPPPAPPAPEPGGLQKILQKIKGLFGGDKKESAEPAPGPEGEVVEEDIDSVAKEPVPEDLGDNPGGIDINAKATDEDEFEFFEDAETFYRERFKQSPDSLQKVLSAAGRMLPKRKKK